ncbi:MAG: Smr/MutS family protein [Pseudomonadota bacterium]|nr:Smr/MutS family protein [Pseudomonadota bacterium]
MAKKRQDKAGSTDRGDDDLSLWEKVAQTVAPLGRSKKNRVPRVATPKPKDKPHGKARRKPASEAAPPPLPPRKPPAPPPLNRFDAREQRRLATGRSDIDARIDLHGMRQREAHSALRAFLLRSQQRGHRTVLVITGKGAPRGTQDLAPGEGRGVLRRAVPLWLEEPELRQVVVSHTAAHIRHGGDGALYVRLRKAAR